MTTLKSCIFIILVLFLEQPGSDCKHALEKRRHRPLSKHHDDKHVQFAHRLMEFRNNDNDADAGPVAETANNDDRQFAHRLMEYPNNDKDADAGSVGETINNDDRQFAHRHMESLHNDKDADAGPVGETINNEDRQFAHRHMESLHNDKDADAGPVAENIHNEDRQWAHRLMEYPNNDKDADTGHVGENINNEDRQFAHRLMGSLIDDKDADAGHVGENINNEDRQFAHRLMEYPNNDKDADAGHVPENIHNNDREFAHRLMEYPNNDKDADAGPVAQTIHNDDREFAHRLMESLHNDNDAESVDKITDNDEIPSPKHSRIDSNIDTLLLDKLAAKAKSLQDRKSRGVVSPLQNLNIDSKVIDQVAAESLQKKISEKNRAVGQKTQPARSLEHQKSAVQPVFQIGKNKNSENPPVSAHGSPNEFLLHASPSQGTQSGSEQHTGQQHSLPMAGNQPHQPIAMAAQNPHPPKVDHKAAPRVADQQARKPNEPEPHESDEKEDDSIEDDKHSFIKKFQNLTEYNPTTNKDALALISKLQLMHNIIERRIGNLKNMIKVIDHRVVDLTHWANAHPEAQHNAPAPHYNPAPHPAPHYPNNAQAGAASHQARPVNNHAISGPSSVPITKWNPSIYMQPKEGYHLYVLHTVGPKFKHPPARPNQPSHPPHPPYHPPQQGAPHPQYHPPQQQYHPQPGPPLYHPPMQPPHGAPHPPYHQPQHGAPHQPYHPAQPHGPLPNMTYHQQGIYVAPANNPYQPTYLNGHTLGHQPDPNTMSILQETKLWIGVAFGTVITLIVGSVLIILCLPRLRNTFGSAGRAMMDDANMSNNQRLNFGAGGCKNSKRDCVVSMMQSCKKSNREESSDWSSEEEEVFNVSGIQRHSTPNGTPLSKPSASLSKPSTSLSKSSTPLSKARKNRP